MNNNMRLLNVPTEEPVRYSTNFIQTAVCELRFPILLELEDKSPVKFQSALKKRYPFYSKQQGISLGANTASPLANRYLFESKKKNWLVTLSPSSLALETSKYTLFKDFSDRIDGLLNTVGGFLDTDFFTRVGLRYINAIPLDDYLIDGWINPSLITPVNEGVLGSLSAFQSEIRGYIHEGDYTFRHGVDTNTLKNGNPTASMLDFDYYSEGTEFDNVLPLIEKFSHQNFSFFRWTLGEKAKETLGEGIAKK